MQFSFTKDSNFIWPIDGALKGTTNPGQSGHGCIVNEGALPIFEDWNLIIR